MNLARESAKSIIYTSCNAYYSAKNNTVKNEYSVEIGGPLVMKQAFPWWIPVVAAVNVVAAGLLVWRGLAAFLPKRKKKGEEQAQTEITD